MVLTVVSVMCSANNGYILSISHVAITTCFRYLMFVYDDDSSAFATADDVTVFR